MSGSGGVVVVVVVSKCARREGGRLMGLEYIIRTDRAAFRYMIVCWRNK